jgi:hypothetical protein
MPDDLRIQINSTFNAGPLKAGMADAAAAVQTGGKQMQAAFEGIGTAVGEASNKVLNMLYPTKQLGEESDALTVAINSLTTSIEKMSAAKKEDTGSTRGMTSAMGAARVEMGALEGSTGMMAGGLARVAAQSSALAPIISAAFPLFAVGAFADIIVMAGEKLYNFYQNVILSRDELKAYGEVEKTITEETERLAKETEAAYIALLKLEDPLEADREKMRGLSTEIFEFKANLKDFSEPFATFVSGFKNIHANEMQGKVSLVNNELARLRSGMVETQQIEQALLEQGLPFTSEIPKMQEQINLLQKLSAEMNVFQTKVRIEKSIGGAELAKGEEEAAKKTQEAIDSAAKTRQEAA